MHKVNYKFLKWQAIFKSYLFQCFKFCLLITYAAGRSLKVKGELMILEMIRMTSLEVYIVNKQLTNINKQQPKRKQTEVLLGKK